MNGYKFPPPRVTDPAAFGRRYQPVAAIAFATQHGGKQFDERYPVDWRPAIIPGAVARDPHVEAAQLDRDAAAVGR